MTRYSAYTDIIDIDVPFADETNNLIATGRYSTAPALALKQLINTVIVGLKADGLFAKGDLLHVYGQHETLFSYQNWIKNAHNATPSSSGLTFTAKQGHKGDGTNGYLDLNYIPSSQAVNYALGACSVLVMMPILGTTTGRQVFGAHNTGAPQKRTYITAYTAGVERGFINSGTYNEAANMTAGSYFGYTRTGNNLQAYVDGIPTGLVKASVADSALVDLSLLALGYNLNGTPSGLNNGQIALKWLGGYLNDAEMANLYARLKYFYDNVANAF